MADPVLGHIHIPKCAGTSCRLLLEDVFSTSHLHLYYRPGTRQYLTTTSVYSDEQLASFLQEGSAKSFSSHYVRRFPEVLAGRRIYYFTFLRHPVQQFISYLNFARQIFSDLTDPVLLSHLPPNMPELSLRECACWLLSHDTNVFISFRENFTTNFLALSEVQAKYGYGYADPRYRGMRLYTARNVLNAFFFVGISEQMNASWRLLRRKLTSVGIDIPPLPMRRNNVSPIEDDDLSWLHSRDEVGKQVFHSLREDLKLYRWALRRFHLQLEEERRGQPLSWWQKAIA